MTQDEMKQEALKRVADANSDITELDATKIYDNFLDGTLVTVSYKAKEGKQWSYVYFRDSEPRFYRYSSDVLNTVANYKERRWFFRFLEFAGVGGLIAFMLVLIFSVLLCLLAFSSTPANPTIVEVIKLSFTIILGYFFGQASGRK